MRFRKLRIAWSVAWGIAAVLLCVLWARSLSRIERLTWHYSNAKALQIGTVPGAIDMGSIVDSPVPVQVQKANRQWMTEWFESMQLYGGKMSSWFAIWSTTTGSFVRIPNWFLLLGCCGLGSFPWLPFKRFSLRTLLIATTLVAVVLGLIVWLASS
jgi:hypothetical protein